MGINRLVGNFRLTAILTITLVAAATVVFLAVVLRGSTASISSQTTHEDALARITETARLWQWEFLSIEDEELVDTVRKGIISNDYLARIYYGTLRLGIDMAQADEDWLTTTDGRIDVVLPEIGLLSEGFIDEARTKAFFETGTWSDKDRAALYERAVAKMRSRCLTEENLRTAEENARRQIHRMLGALGYTDVTICFGKRQEALHLHE